MTEATPFASTVETINENESQRTYLALPMSVEGLMAQRKKPQKATLHDRVESLYLGLFQNEEFRRLREPVYREQSVEGDLRDDDARAAMMIRAEALRKGEHMVAKEKLATIRRSILVVETRYNATRRQRLALSEQ
jgi:hypothetical protein